LSLWQPEQYWLSNACLPSGAPAATVVVVAVAVMTFGGVTAWSSAEAMVVRMHVIASALIAVAPKAAAQRRLEWGAKLVMELLE
jgi:hypothetical protein